MNSGFDDYNVLLTNGGKTMYFTSRRSNTTGGGLNPDDQLFFEDIYKVEWNAATGEWEGITNQLDKMNSDGFESLHYISSDTLSGIITWNTALKWMLRKRNSCILIFGVIKNDTTRANLEQSKDDKKQIN